MLFAIVYHFLFFFVEVVAFDAACDCLFLLIILLVELSCDCCLSLLLVTVDCCLGSRIYEQGRIFP